MVMKLSAVRYPRARAHLGGLDEGVHGFEHTVADPGSKPTEDTGRVPADGSGDPGHRCGACNRLNARAEIAPLG